MRKIVSSVMLALILLSSLTMAFNVKPAKAEWTGTVYIRADGSIYPPDAPIITDDNVTYTLTDNITSTAANGIVVERDNIIIDGKGHSIQGTGGILYTGISLIKRINVTVRNIQILLFGVGVRLAYSYNNSIIGNTIKANNECGVRLDYSRNNSIIRNNIVNNERGIWLDYSYNNSIIGNTIKANNECGVRLEFSSNNWFYHNNFIDKRVQVYSVGSKNVWDDGYPSGGNYWSDYIGVDLYSGPYQNLTGSDGIGDTSYVIDANNVDRYPLMAPFTTFSAGVWNETEYFVDVASNSTISGFVFDPIKGPYLKFNVTSDDGTIGFCRVTIPKSLLWAEDGWTITINNQQITDYSEVEDENNTYIYFTYHHSTQTIVIQGTNAIPELPSTLCLPGFLMLTAIPLIFTKKKRFKKAKHI